MIYYFSFFPVRFFLQREAEKGFFTYRGFLNRYNSTLDNPDIQDISPQAFSLSIFPPFLIFKKGYRVTDLS